MSETVYLIGAGANVGIRGLGGKEPPLARDFFKKLLRAYPAESPLHRLEWEALFAYVERYWRFSMVDLAEREFDLEECFTQLALDAHDAARRGIQEVEKLRRLVFILTNMIAEYLAGFAQGLRSGTTHEAELAFLWLGRRIYEDRSCVLTFNYDSLLEVAIEVASGLSPRPAGYHISPVRYPGDDSDVFLSYSEYRWNRPRAYGIRFDMVQLHRPGVDVLVPAERFYEHPANAPYEAPFLKLHGSVTWFCRTGRLTFQQGVRAHIPPPSPSTVLLRNYSYRDGVADLRGELLHPLLITPTLQKTVDDAVFGPLWERAALELRECRKLIVIGYSFPPTDFHVRRLIREVCADRVKREVHVVNPDPHVGEVVRELTGMAITRHESLTAYRRMQERS